MENDESVSKLYVILSPKKYLYGKTANEGGLRRRSLR